MIFLTQTYVKRSIEFKNDCNFLARPRTSNLNRKLSVEYLQKDQDESILSHTC